MSARLLIAGMLSAELLTFWAHRAPVGGPRSTVVLMYQCTCVLNYLYTSQIIQAVLYRIIQ